MDIVQQGKAMQVNDGEVDEAQHAHRAPGYPIARGPYGAERMGECNECTWATYRSMFRAARADDVGHAEALLRGLRRKAERGDVNKGGVAAMRLCGRVQGEVR